MELAIDGNTSGALQSRYEQKSEHTSKGHEYIIVSFLTPFFAFCVYIF